MANNSPFSPFRNPLYLSYWGAGLVANFGWLVQSVGAAWLMATIGGSQQMVALVQAAVALPMMLFLMVAGTCADRLGRRRVILASQGAALAVSVALAFWAWMGWLTPWGLLGFTFALGLSRAFNHPAWQTYVSDFMPREELPRAIVMNSVSFNLARAAGPALGGVIVASLGAFVAFAFNAVSCLAMIVTMIRRKDGPRPVGRQQGFWASMRSGAVYVWRTPILRRLTLAGAAFNFAGTALMALMPLVARDMLGGGAETYGLLLGAFGAGAVLAALLVAPWRDRLSLRNATAIGIGTSAFANMAIVLWPQLLPAALACAFAGAAWVMTLSGFHTRMQLTADLAFMSRSNAVYQTFTFAAVAGGAAIWGAVADMSGLPTALLGGGFVMGGSVVIALIATRRA